MANTAITRPWVFVQSNEGAPQCRCHAKTAYSQLPAGPDRPRTVSPPGRGSATFIGRVGSARGGTGARCGGRQQPRDRAGRHRRVRLDCIASTSATSHDPRRGRTRPRERCPPGRRVTGPSPRLAPAGHQGRCQGWQDRRTPNAKDAETPRTPRPRTPEPTPAASTSRKADRGRPEVARTTDTTAPTESGPSTTWRRTRSLPSRTGTPRRSQRQGHRRGQRRPAGVDPLEWTVPSRRTLDPVGTRESRPSPQTSRNPKPRNRIRNRSPCWRRSTPCPPARARPRPPPSHDRSAWSRVWYRVSCPQWG